MDNWVLIVKFENMLQSLPLNSLDLENEIFRKLIIDMIDILARIGGTGLYYHLLRRLRMQDLKFKIF